MFYCDECAKQRDWPNWMGFMSHGLCEVCGKERDCYDLPARLLPIPPAQRTARGRGLDLNRKPLSDDEYNATLTHSDERLQHDHMHSHPIANGRGAFHSHPHDHSSGPEQGHFHTAHNHEHRYTDLPGHLPASVKDAQKSAGRRGPGSPSK